MIDLNNNLKEGYNTSINCYKGKTIEILDHLIKKHKIDNIYSNRVFKGKYFNNLDRDINSFLMERGVTWYQKISLVFSLVKE